MCRAAATDLPKNQSDAASAKVENPRSASSAVCEFGLNQFLHAQRMSPSTGRVAATDDRVEGRLRAESSNRMHSKQTVALVRCSPPQPRSNDSCAASVGILEPSVRLAGDHVEDRQVAYGKHNHHHIDLAAGLLTGWRDDQSYSEASARAAFFVFQASRCAASHLMKNTQNEQTNHFDSRWHDRTASHRTVCRLTCEPAALSGQP